MVVSGGWIQEGWRFPFFHFAPGLPLERLCGWDIIPIGDSHDMI